MTATPVDGDTVTRLLLVRHGQASFGAADYDRLSALGATQGARLGAHWAVRGVRADRVYVGPRRRHRETADAVGATMAVGGWPAAVEVEGALDEHQGARLMDATAGETMIGAEAARRYAASPAEEQRRYLAEYSRRTRAWACGELAGEGVEPFAAFRARVAKAVWRMLAAAEGGTVVAVTSGGPVAAAVGLALGADDLRTLELSWVVRNASVTELAADGGRLALVAFNETAHLDLAERSMV